MAHILYSLVYVHPIQTHSSYFFYFHHDIHSPNRTIRSGHWYRITFKKKELEGKDFDLSDRDTLFNDAARLIVQNQIGSTSLLQRRMKLGYNRAGRLMDQLEAAGIVGPNQGSKARDVLIKTEMELQQHLDMLG